MSAHPPKHRAPIPVHFIDGRRTAEPGDTNLAAQTLHKVGLVVLLACSVWLGAQQTVRSEHPSALETWVRWLGNQGRPAPQNAGIMVVQDKMPSPTGTAFATGATPTTTSEPDHPGVSRPY